MNINRYLHDKTMDRIDHALGRPLDPLAESYRNHYAAFDPEANLLAASPFWEEGGRGRDLRHFFVTLQGRIALAWHLKQIRDPHRAFTVTFNGYSSDVVAKSSGKARYSHFLSLRDVIPDLTFHDFCTRSSVRSGAFAMSEVRP